MVMARFGSRQRWVRDAAVVAVLVATIAGVAWGLATGSSSGKGPGRPGTVVNERLGYSVRPPAGWHLARHRLVPELLDPREILALGTFPMPVGGGGNCGAEPTAAVRRMRSGDGLIEIKELALSAPMGRRLHRGTFPPTLARELSDVALRRGVWFGGARLADIAYGQLTFRASGRWFEALFYVKGPPRRRLDQMERILAGIDFHRGPFARVPGHQAPGIDRGWGGAGPLGDGSV
jgi:hypothetical protein